MMVTIGSYMHMLRRRAGLVLRRPQWHAALRGIGWVLCGGVFSAAALLQAPMPLALGLLCGAPPGWPALLAAIGASAGYVLFWGATAAAPCIAWLVLGFGVVALLGGRKLPLEAPLLIPALAAVIVSGTGVVFLFWLDQAVATHVYLLQVILALASAWLFRQLPERGNMVLDALRGGVLVLAMAQLLPLPWLDLGYVAAAALTAAGAFPTAALSGLALDLAGITAVPMTAALSTAFLLRLVPRSPRWMWYAAPALAYVPVAMLTGVPDWTPLPALAAGGLVGFVLPHPVPAGRRGETAVAQVRLELASGVLLQLEEALLEMPEPETDSQALLQEAAETACAACPERKTCSVRETLLELDGSFLQRPFLQRENLPEGCRKSGRLLDALRRSQSHLRAIRGEHLRRREAKSALILQYQTLASYLQELADQLTRRERPTAPRYQPRVTAQSRGREMANGDRYVWFAGTEGRYYVLLCDGMGTGMGAAQASGQGLQLLRRCLEAGLPPEYAMGCLNSLCVLTEQGGLTTVDLAEIRLDTGRAALYKWGSAPSFVVDQAGIRRVGRGSPPPGLSMGSAPEAVERVSLRQGETLILVSDGISAEALLGLDALLPGMTTGQLAQKILDCQGERENDDATAVIVQLTACRTD